MPSQIDLKHLGERLHHRLLSGQSLTVTSEIAEAFLPAIATSLAREFSQLSDPHFIGMAVDDALISYFERPSQFDPARSSLFTYLRIRAKSCLLNYLGRKKNTHQENKSVELDSPETVYEVEARNGQDAEITLIEHESQTKIMQRLREVVTDPVDFQLLSLMLEGVRETDAFAAVLGIAALPGSEQARLVKQHKDRIKKAVQRKLRR